jgi:Ca-activated chloride channel family protein
MKVIGVKIVRRPALLGLLLFGLPLLVFVPLRAFLQSDDFKISTNVDLVLLDISVKDAKGGYVSDLTGTNFKVEENGIAQKIVSFANMDVPVAAGLILDASGSMRTKRGDVDVAGITFIDASNPKDQIFVMDFNDKVLPGLPDDVPFTDDIELLRLALSKHRTEGKTVLYDAIEAGLQHLGMAQREKKTLLVVSDGGDNASRHNLAEVMRAIEDSQTTIYTVGIADPDDPDRNPGVLQRIAAVSGGESFQLDRYEDIVPTLKKIAVDIRHRYTIGYVPDRGNTKIGLRKIRVTASASDHGRLIVRTRTSYSDPRQQ